MKCTAPFEANQELYSTLEGEEWKRLDFCKTCFTPTEIVWKSFFKITKKEKWENLDELEKAYALLTELLQNEVSEVKEEAFILALYLQRKKILVLRKDGNKDFMAFEHVASGELLLIPKLSPFDINLKEVEQRLKCKLN